MLLELSIRNLALIDAANISFQPGFNVMTGETGAGKSIVVDAVSLVLGARADRDMVQTGAEKARVEAAFDIHGNELVRRMLLDGGVEVEEDTLFLSREVQSIGRTVCRINGTMVPLGFLKQVSELLLDLHGQHEHQSLLHTRKHLEYLDDFGASALGEGKREVAELFGQWKEAHSAYAELSEKVAQREQRIDILRYQLKELTAANLVAGEEEELHRQRELFRNSERISEGVTESFAWLYQGREDQPSAVDALKEAVDALAPLSELDESFRKLHERISDLYYQLEDAALELRDVHQNLEYDADTSEEVDARLDALSTLRRKYHQDSAGMLRMIEEMRLELETLDAAEDRLSELAHRQEALAKQLYQASEDLSRRRRDVAQEFERRMLENLMDLGMKHTRFEVHFGDSPGLEEAEASFSANGFDRVEFLISPNPGEPLKPLVRIASGGELSRIMLALKSIAADVRGVGSMVFDEIDTGISGRMAQVVAEKMAALAKGHQVICVTHLPQLAAMADAQFLVQKQVVGERTKTQVLLLDEHQRCQEIARLVGGADPDSPSSLQHAGALLYEAETRKAQLRAGGS